MKKPWPTSLNKGPSKGRKEGRERERERTEVKPNPKWFAWFVLQLACVKCVLFMIDRKLGRIHAQLSSALFTFVNQYGCGKKVTELQRRRKRTRRRRWECSDPNLSPLKKQNKHMPFNKTHLDQLVSSTTTDFRVSIESHAGSTKVTPKLPFSFYTHDLPSSIIESWLLCPIIILQVAKKTEKWSTFSSLHLKPPQTNEWMKWLNLSQP